MQLISKPLAKRFLDEGAPSIGKIDADDQAFAPDFADEIEVRGQLFQPGAQFGAARANIGEQILVFDDRQKFKRRRANQRAAAKSRTVHSGRKRRGELLVGDERAERKAAGQRLGDGDDIRKRLEISDRRIFGRCGRGRI